MIQANNTVFGDKSDQSVYLLLSNMYHDTYNTKNELIAYIRYSWRISVACITNLLYVLSDSAHLYHRFHVALISVYEPS